ncbi:MAG: hypothetical protein MUF64_07690 [Polyangiaceae bacterium]|jgi:hypothetical protein|nr:hypothetical protein [Polyangiaceae bacterium]
MKPTSFQKLLAGYILKTLAAAQQQGRSMNLDDLVSEVKARRGDVRVTLSMLHREGYLDAVRMRLTLQGFMIGASLEQAKLRPLRPAAVAVNDICAA